MSSPAPRLLTIDVGNSRIKFGLFDRSARAEVGVLPQCDRSLAVAIDAPIPWDTVASWIDGRFSSAVVAGANPRGIAKVLDGWTETSGPPPRVIDDGTRFPLEIRVDEPRKVGIDRLLNAVAANVVRLAGQPAVIVDTGTATTVDLVSAGGAFEGGAILPGFELCARALHHYTALLPLLSIEELASEPHPPLGRNTRAALRSGLFWGQLGAVRELIGRMAKPDGTPLVFLTGGGAGLLAPHLPQARWEPHLALQGIALVADHSGL